MRKVLGSFIFWFGIISLLIIYMNYRGQDEKNIALIGLNPILFKIVYIEPFRTWLNSGTVMRYFLGEPSATLNIYLAHLLTILKDENVFPNMKPTIWFEVENVESEYNKLKENGDKFLSEPFEIMTGMAVEFEDPFGNRLGITDYSKR